MMNITTKSVTAIIAVSLGFTLTSCGSDRTDMTANVKAKLALLAKARKMKREGKVPVAAPAPTRAGFAKAGIPVAYIGSPQTGYGGFGVQVAKNGKWDTYMTSEKFSVTVDAGVITATRGFVGDLMSQELSVPVADLFKGPFPYEYQRTQTMIDLDISIVESEYTCTIAAPTDRDLRVLDELVKTRRYTEVCRSSKRAFRNDYWLEISNNKIIQSQQSVHPNTGFVIWQSIAR
jgi:hypothetical protein